MEVLYTLLAERYERGSVMLNRNLPFSKWEKIDRQELQRRDEVRALRQRRTDGDPLNCFPGEEPRGSPNWLPLGGGTGPRASRLRSVRRTRIASVLLYD